MIKIKIVFWGLIFYVLLISTSFAQTVTEEKAKEWSLFIAGLSAGLLNHEVGHQVVATAYGENISWNFNGKELTWHSSTDGTKLRNIALGGTLAEMLSSEILLGSQVPKNNSFVIGWLIWNIANPLLYVAAQERSGDYGDLGTIKKNENGIDVRYVELAKIVHAGWTAYRLFSHKEFKEQKLMFFITPFSNKLGVMANIQYRW